ncbi:corticotropin-releasing factor receptor 1-like [Argiope bruennichi]|uniref:corticotropin-releasing factor receptor 1-like n=1 Tax=Argiope bruennichi TaxID=94029 RepID=UPI002493EDE2|nr:corticotropin-releasing factor receptor 1-like [Argiope bruennichi]
MLAVRSCDENGLWVGNITNFTRCVTNIQELYPNSWTPTIIALIVVIGSTLSIITLCLSLFIFFYFRSLKCSRLQVHRNLSIALLLNLILLIVSSSPILTDSSYKHTEWLCKSVLTLQMYSSLASINWMFVEGLLLHSRVTVHIFKKDAPFKLYYCIGWGFPAICIGLWCLLMTYHHNTHCWAGYGGQQYIWLITGPMIAALLVNSVFLVDIIRILVTKRLAKQTAETTHVRKAVKATALLFPLLGIPHLLFCINPKDNGTLEEAYMIVNAFVKSSQGLFVSVLYCFMNADVQMALRKAYMRAVAQRNPNYHYRCRRGLSQTSGTYVSSHSEGSSFQSESNRKKRPPSRAVLRLQEVPKHQENKGKVETATVIF